MKVSTSCVGSRRSLTRAGILPPSVMSSRWSEPKLTSNTSPLSLHHSAQGSAILAMVVGGMYFEGKTPVKDMREKLPGEIKAGLGTSPIPSRPLDPTPALSSCYFASLLHYPDHNPF